jgi:predicted metal-dependent hydrolase
MKLREQQRSLFDSDTGHSVSRWRDGATLDYLGQTLQLRLVTDSRHAHREDDVLHLPLPPDATPRQIQDAAESWLRREATTLFSMLIAREAQRLSRDMPALALSFSARGSWTQTDERGLRCNWHLIEQPMSVIELALAKAAAQLPMRSTSADLFGF